MSDEKHEALGDELQRIISSPAYARVIVLDMELDDCTRENNIGREWSMACSTIANRAIADKIPKVPDFPKILMVACDRRSHGHTERDSTFEFLKQECHFIKNELLGTGFPAGRPEMLEEAQESLVVYQFHSEKFLRAESGNIRSQAEETGDIRDWIVRHGEPGIIWHNCSGMSLFRSMFESYREIMVFNCKVIICTAMWREQKRKDSDVFEFIESANYKDDRLGWHKALNSGIPIVTCHPTCLSTDLQNLTDLKDWPAFAPHNAEARAYFKTAIEFTFGQTIDWTIEIIDSLYDIPKESIFDSAQFNNTKSYANRGKEEAKVTLSRAIGEVLLLKNKNHKSGDDLPAELKWAAKVYHIKLDKKKEYEKVGHRAKSLYANAKCPRNNTFGDLVGGVLDPYDLNNYPVETTEYQTVRRKRGKLVLRSAQKTKKPNEYARVWRLVYQSTDTFAFSTNFRTTTKPLHFVMRTMGDTSADFDKTIQKDFKSTVDSFAGAAKSSEIRAKTVTPIESLGNANNSQEESTENSKILDALHKPHRTWHNIWCVLAPIHFNDLYKTKWVCPDRRLQTAVNTISYSQIAFIKMLIQQLEIVEPSLHNLAVKAFGDAERFAIKLETVTKEWVKAYRETYMVNEELLGSLLGELTDESHVGIGKDLYWIAKTFQVLVNNPKLTL